MLLAASRWPNGHRVKMCRRSRWPSDAAANQGANDRDRRDKGQHMVWAACGGADEIDDITNQAGAGRISLQRIAGGRFWGANLRENRRLQLNSYAIGKAEPVAQKN